MDILRRIFEFGASSLRIRNTADPAGVSAPIKLRLERDVVVGRLERAAAQLQQAADATCDTERSQAIAKLFPRRQVASIPPAAAAVASLIASGTARVGASGLTDSMLGIRPIKPVRSFGG